MKSILLVLLFLAGIGGIALVWAIIAKVITKIFGDKKEKK